MRRLKDDKKMNRVHCIQGASKNWMAEMRLLQWETPQCSLEGIEGCVGSWVSRKVVPIPDGFREEWSGVCWSVSIWSVVPGFVASWVHSILMLCDLWGSLQLWCRPRCDGSYTSSPSGCGVYEFGEMASWECSSYLLRNWCGGNLQ